MAHHGPTLIYDDERQGLQGVVPTRWGEHYNIEKRDVLRFDLAPWVVAYASASGGAGRRRSSSI